MGGIPINISAWGIEPASFDQAVKDIAARIEELESMISTYREDSEVSRLNRGEKLKHVPHVLAKLAENAYWTSVMTQGAFDITVKPLVELWRRCRQEQRLPTEDELRAARSKVGYKKYYTTAKRLGTMPGKDSLGLNETGVMLDFGGIAKGYFADEAVTILRLAGSSRCLVDIGGDIVTWQEYSAGTPFRVGINHPQHSGKVLAVLEIQTGSVVTSGSYERFYEIDGKRYCHIFDPRTGKPIEGMLSVTLTAPTGLDADSLATAVFVMGMEAGREFVEAQEWIEAVIIAEGEGGGMEIYVSPGLVDRVEFVAQ
jgi:thiamine biosynthesis lipoprotein